MRGTPRQVLRRVLALLVAALLVAGLVPGLPEPPRALAELTEGHEAALGSGEEEQPLGGGSEGTGVPVARDVPDGDDNARPLGGKDDPADVAVLDEDAEPELANELAIVVQEEGPGAAPEALADSGPVDGTGQSEGESTLGVQAVGVSNPRVRAASSMEAGQVATWDCVWFGSYPQTEVAPSDAAYASLALAGWDANGDATVGGTRYRRVSKSDATYSGYWSGDGYGSATYRYFRYEPIKWRVLKVSRGSTALAVADRALDDQRYNTNLTSVTWATSSVRSWLNGYGAASNQPGTDYSLGSFLGTAFSSGERSAILTTDVVNANNTDYGTAGGAGTRDRVFLLSEAEMCDAAHGFASGYGTYDEARRCKPTDFAHAMGAWRDNGGSYDDYCWWWLRSPGYYSDYAAVVRIDGFVDRYGLDVNDVSYAVRPALNLNLASTHLSWAGTVSSNGDVDEQAAPGGGSDTTASHFELGKDNNAFVHTNNPKAKGAGFAGVKDYSIDGAYYNRLTKNSDVGEKNSIKKDMSSEWEGSCYGIAATMGLLYEGKIALSNLTDASGVKSYRGLKYPCKDRKFLNTINFYQLSQGLKSVGRNDASVSKTFNNGILTGLINWLGSRDSLQSFLRNVLRSCRNNHVALLCFSTSGGGHAVLITGSEYDSVTGRYKIQVYDENCVSSPTDPGEFGYMTIEGDCSGFSYVDANGDSINSSTYKSLYLVDWEKMNGLRPLYSQEVQDHSRIVFTMGTSARVSVRDGSYLAYDGERLSGTMNVYGIETEETDATSRLVVETDEFDELSLIGTGGTVDLAVRSENGFVSLSGSGIDEATLSAANGVSLDGDSCDFEAFVTTDEVGDNESGLISVAAKTEGGVEVHPPGSTVLVKADKGMTEVKTASYVGVEVLEETYGSVNDEFAVNDEGEIVGRESPFSDVSDAVAHHEDIVWLASGISKGWDMPDGSVQFRPYASVARADMAAFLFRLAKSWGIVDDSWQPKGGSVFSDVTAATAHYREVIWLAESGISKGWDVTGGRKEFRPYANVARADMAAFLHRLAAKAGIGDPAGGGVSFRDVTARTAHADDISWLAATGVSKGWDVAGGKKEFRPLAYVARADMAAFLHRLDGLR